MKPEEIEIIARTAAKEAVAEMTAEERRKKRGQTLHNTRRLMENHNRMVQSVQEGVAELVDLTDEPVDGLEADEALFVESILKSKTRSLVMLAHIDKCLQLLEAEEYRNNTPEKYLAYKYFYLDELSYDSIAEVYGYSDRTARR
ncbi:MAG: helix-turn-helix domain-containing protein [Lachnospiraceae bacterium]